MTRLGPKNQSLYKSALYLVVYIRELGAEPRPIRTPNYEAWAIQIHRQYDKLLRTRGSEAAKVAKLRGRAVVAEIGLLSAAAAALPGPKEGERVRCLICRKWTWPSLDTAIRALKGLRKAPNIRNPDQLTAYPCPRQRHGWHIGHAYRWAAGSLCIEEHR